MEKNIEKYLQKAEVLIEALPYIQKFNRKIIVVKYGGSAMLTNMIAIGIVLSVASRRQKNLFLE